VVGPILQMAGAILLGYLIAFRGKSEVRRQARVIIPVGGEKLEQELGLFIETRAYRVGFIYIISGYLLQMLEIDSSYLLSLDRFSKLMTIIAFSFILFFIGKFVSEYWGTEAYNKTGVFDPKTEGNEQKMIITSKSTNGATNFLLKKIFPFFCLLYAIVAIIYVVNDLNGVTNNIPSNFISGTGFLFTVLGTLIAVRQN
jgi:hypothetical protein